DRILQLGGAAIQGGLYVSPHPWHKDVRAAAERLGLTAMVSTATTEDLDVGGQRDPRELARSLWPVDELDRRYRGFVERFAGVPDVLRGMRRDRRRLLEKAFLPGALSMAVHFHEEYSHSSAPEVFLAAASQRTSRIRLGHGIVQLPLGFNHTARVAERIATLDLVSDGRVEFGTGESSSEAELGGFGVDRATKRDQWEEALDAVTRMFVETPFAGIKGK